MTWDHLDNLTLCDGCGPGDLSVDSVLYMMHPNLDLCFVDHLKC